MKNKIGDQTIKFTNCPRIIGNYAIVGEKEGNGTFKDYYDFILKDDLFGEKTFEHAERKIIEQAISQSIEKAKLNISDIDLLIGGDLLNQIISMSFTARYFDRPFLGVYGACSTMAESLAIGAALVNAEYVKNVVCSTGSHFSSAERQYRFPLELGNQRPPTSQWTVTGAGSSILSLSGEGHKITMATFGKVTDYGVSDVNNMGAAMAPAAMSTLISDCGQMIFNNNQKTFQGGSGAGCSAAVLNSFILKKMDEGVFKKVLFAATGALLSTLSSQQGDSIPGICHAVVIEKGR